MLGFRYDLGYTIVSDCGCGRPIPHFDLQHKCKVVVFLPARRYASAGYRDRNVSVCLSVRPSVRHAPVLCQNEES